MSLRLLISWVATAGASPSSLSVTAARCRTAPFALSPLVAHPHTSLSSPPTAWCTKGRYVDLQGSSEFERRRSAYIRLAFHLLLLLSAALQLPQQIDHVRFGVDTRLGFALHMLADEFFLVSVSLVVLQWALLSTEVLGQKKRGHVYTVCVCVPNAVLLMYVVGMMCVLLVPSTGANDGSLANACTAKFECECNGFLGECV